MKILMFIPVNAKEGKNKTGQCATPITKSFLRMKGYNQISKLLSIHNKELLLM